MAIRTPATTATIAAIATMSASIPERPGPSGPAVRVALIELTDAKPAKTSVPAATSEIRFDHDGASVMIAAIAKSDPASSRGP